MQELRCYVLTAATAADASPQCILALEMLTKGAAPYRGQDGGTYEWEMKYANVILGAEDVWLFKLQPSDILIGVASGRCCRGTYRLELDLGGKLRTIGRGYWVNAIKHLVQQVQTMHPNEPLLKLKLSARTVVGDIDGFTCKKGTYTRVLGAAVPTAAATATVTPGGAHILKAS